MSTVAHFSLAEYEHMVDVGAFAGEFEKRVELIRGEIVQMTSINIAHANCVTLVTEWSFEVAPLDRIMIRTQNPIRIPTNNSEPEPDVVWVHRKEYSRHPEPGDVLLIIEVAESSLEYDRGEKKMGVYCQAGIPEYWIVNLIDEQVEVYRKPCGRTYQEQSVYRGDAGIHPLALPTATMQASRIFGE
jgi:Uma2 family endonuclease